MNDEDEFIWRWTNRGWPINYQLPTAHCPPKLAGKIERFLDLEFLIWENADDLKACHAELSFSRRIIRAENVLQDNFKTLSNQGIEVLITSHQQILLKLPSPPFPANLLST